MCVCLSLPLYHQLGEYHEAHPTHVNVIFRPLHLEGSDISLCSDRQCTLSNVQCTCAVKKARRLIFEIRRLSHIGTYHIARQTLDTTY